MQSEGVHLSGVPTFVWLGAAQVYLDADLLKSEGDVLRDAERALLLARGRLLDSYSNVEAAADLVWDEVQVRLRCWLQI